MRGLPRVEHIALAYARAFAYVAGAACVVCSVLSISPLLTRGLLHVWPAPHGVRNDALVLIVYNHVNKRTNQEA